jgi:ferredoxin
MKVKADRDTCIGAGICSIQAPEVFALDDQGLVEVLQGDIDPADAEAVALVEEAVTLCPVRALALEAAGEGASGD